MKRSNRTSETPTHELAREMVALDNQIDAAKDEHRFLDAHDLEHTRWLIALKRSEMLRRGWEARRMEALEL